MKCINRIKICAVTVAVCMLFTGCGNVSYTLKYNPDSSVSSYRIVNTEMQDAVSAFAEDLCVVSEDVMPEGLDMSSVTAAALFDVDNGEVLCAKNVYEKLHPASLTKVMTALVALKYGNPDDILTASENVKINESGLSGDPALIGYKTVKLTNAYVNGCIGYLEKSTWASFYKTIYVSSYTYGKEYQTSTTRTYLEYDVKATGSFSAVIDKKASKDNKYELGTIKGYKSVTIKGLKDIRYSTYHNMMIQQIPHCTLCHLLNYHIPMRLR